MIPAGYAASIYVWAKRPDLSDEEKSARQQQLLDWHDALATGQLTPKASRTLTSGTLNGKTFTWAPGLTTEEKLSVVTDVLDRLGLLGEVAPVRITFAKFDDLQR